MELDPLAPFPVAPEDARYLDRELTQLQFNARVLALALDETHPLLERVKFCAIHSSNTDEWVQKRLAPKMEDARSAADASGWLTAKQLLAALRHAMAEISRVQARIAQEVLFPALAAEGIHIVDHDDLTDAEIKVCAEYFHERMFPLLTPLAIDPGRPFPHISTLSLNLAVQLDVPGTGPSVARVKIPHQLSRFVELDGMRFVPTEQVIAANLDELFPGVQILQHGLFRVTRHAHQAFAEEEAEDLLETIESGLLERRFGPVVRVEVGPDLDADVLSLFAHELGIDEDAIIEVGGMLDLGGLWQLVAVDRPDLKDPPWTPVVPKPFVDVEDFFALIRRSPLLVHHPYESFEHTVQELIERAADDPDVVAIKLTIYRTTAQENPIVEALIRAAEAGKQTAALVELKARFDEEANIRRARRLERAGVHVVYGLIGLKTHTKTCLIVRNEGGVLRRYAHIGTGNYHPATAEIYEDLGVFTADEAVSEDVAHVFNMLTGYSRREHYPTLLVAPLAMRARILELIRREARAGEDGHIVIKCNNLVDTQVVDALYQASQAGARIELIVRSMVAIRPQVPGLSERITVRSLVGRFLEHSRIFRFGSPRRGRDYLIGSADMMARNLDDRVETMVPVTSERNVARLEEILQVVLADNRRAWELDAGGRWHRVEPREGQDVVDAHTELAQLALGRAAR